MRDKTDGADPSTLRAARVVIAALLATCLLCQVLVIPWLAADTAARFPEAAHLRQPVTVQAVLVVAAVEAALLSAWPLLRLFQPDAVLRRRALIFADLLACSLLAAALLQGGLLGFLSRSQLCPPAVGLMLVAGITLSGAATLVVLVLRHRLRQAARRALPGQPLAAAC